MNELEGYLPISGLQHMLFCPRRCALIHLEGLWDDNFLTILGKALHEKADSGEAETRLGVKVERSLSLRSDSLRLYGQADIVEFHRAGISWHPIPVEYKKGRPIKNSLQDKVQLCAQGICLEEMLGIEIKRGFLYYGAQKKRLEVPFDRLLREATRKAAEDFHALIRLQILPLPLLEPKCKNCSLRETCMPETSILQKNDYSLEELDL